ncbi:hypothetical protein Moror_8333 [Moniliophthora roreri MCA 2997]|uniref:Uncharacterized protein n=1 Tax=Moniliophthora roreri (strain MCA 2997) TaxID=1381753 RepID=V2X4S2_MONRO|nr:hypothetical protein Moror_8333 [Moniliophthora roreri MCA 2997]
MSGGDTYSWGSNASVKGHHIRRVRVYETLSQNLSEWQWHWHNEDSVRRWHRFTRRTISTVKVHPHQSSKFTMFTYEGEDAHEAWERDFKQSLACRSVRSIATLLLSLPLTTTYSESEHTELIPAVHFFTGSLWITFATWWPKNKKRWWENL